MSKKKIEDFSNIKELLRNILKETFDGKLKYLEKRSQNHLSLISSTKSITNNITSIAIKMNSHILPKSKQEKGNSVNKTKKSSVFKNINSPKPSQIKSALGFKTPLSSAKRNIKSIGTKTVGNSKKTDSKINNTIQSRNKDLNSVTTVKTKSFTSKKNHNNEKDKSKFNKTFAHSFTNKEKTLKRKNSVTSFNIKENGTLNKESLIKNNKKSDNNSQIKVKSKNKNNCLVNRVLKTEGNKNDFDIKDKLMNKTFERRKSKTYKNDNSSSSSKLFNKNNKSKEKEKNKNIKTIKEYHNKNKDKEKNNQNKIRITTMESNLQQDYQLFNRDDPLLISPITDNDFKKNELLIGYEIEEKIRNITDYFKDNKENIIQKIFEFLGVKDLLSLNKLSKYFHKNILNYFLKKLNEEKKIIEEQKGLTTITPEQNNFKNFEFSKGTSKSMELLNESIMSKAFQTETLPRYEILFIYQVFFQLINNPIKNLYDNKKEFWDKCRAFFIIESKGKIGDFLKNFIINEKIDISEDNLYRLYKLVNNKLYIIVPSYFNKVCSTTALLTFFIKDILNFLGISMEKEDIKQNGYKTYSNIINSIDKKINIIIKYK